jgi:hypothetical protein
MVWLMLSPYYLILLFFVLVYFLLDLFALLTLVVYFIWVNILPFFVMFLDEKKHSEEESINR